MSSSFSVTPDLEQFVRQEIESGRFPDREAVISHALRLFQRDRDDALQGILAGLADVTAGRNTTARQAFVDLRTELGINRED